MAWDRAGDMDLHVVPPCGTEIYYAATSACGGLLDRDDTSATGPENVYWSTGAARGTYHICAVPYSITGTTNVTVTVRVDGVLVRTFTVSRTTSSGNVACTAGGSQYVGSYTY
jgi:hypothetical protein